MAGQTKTTGTALAVMAQRIAVAPAELEQTLMQTAFKGATAAEFVMLVAVANKYDLDPFVKEIYAFPKKGGGIVPLVPIDGWLKIIHRHPDYAGMETRYCEDMVTPASSAKRCPEWIETTIYHKSTPDRPTVHREWIDEMYRDTGPWNTTTKRMLEWKSIIQTGRKAFGLGGIYDEDEAERINEGEVIDGTAVEIETLGAEGWRALVSAAADIGFDADDILANAAALGYEGTGEEMPREIAKRLYRAMKDAGGDGDGPAGDAAEPEAPTDTSEVVGTQQEPPVCDDGPVPGLDGEQVKAARREETAERAAKSASEIARDLEKKARAAEGPRRITTRQRDLVFTQCTIHGVDDKAELHGWLSENLEVASVSDIPASRLDEVLAWVKTHEKGAGVAG